jgi:hypothetical protein
MSARIGRKCRRPDENSRLFRPVDANSEVSARRAGRKARIARACALGGAIVCGLVAPAIARAADPFGTAQIAQQVDAAVAQATAMVPQASGMAVAPVESAKTLDAATKSLDVATKQAAAVTNQAAAVASNALAEAQRQTQSAGIASVPAVSGDAARPRVKPHRGTKRPRVRTAGRASAPQRSLRPRSSLLAATDGDAARLLASPSTAPSGRSQSSGAPASRAMPKPTRPLPQRPPPLPRSPQPGSALAGQAGGQGPLTPLVVGALAAVLLMMAFEFLPRALPPKAFRKPRLIALAPWHPG